MSDLSSQWGRTAAHYEQHFVDPYHPDARNPLLRMLVAMPAGQAKVVADLGCGTGPLLPLLAEKFQRVVAIDFAEAMLDRARERCRGLGNVEFVQASLLDLSAFEGRFHHAFAVNSLGLPNPADIDASLRQIRSALRPAGGLHAIVPAMDGVHYLTMILLDRALQTGKPLAAARLNAAHLADHEHYDFAFGQFHFRMTEQHFWQPFEIAYRLGRAGFVRVRKGKVRLPWDQFVRTHDLQGYPESWDWFFTARKPVKRP
jgi:SAM-dependent methyltransferase